MKESGPALARRQPTQRNQQVGERYVPMHESLESGLEEERREHER